MKINYRGFEIEATRQKSLGGDMNIYYGIYRISDGWELVAGFEFESGEKVRDFCNHMKKVVDNYLDNENAEQYS